MRLFINSIHHIALHRRLSSLRYSKNCLKPVGSLSPMSQPTNAVGSPAATKRQKTSSGGASVTPKRSNSDAAPVPDLEECGFDDAVLPKLRFSLLHWYDGVHRILPWRRNPHSRLPDDKVAEAAAAGHHPAPTELTDDQFIYYVWVCEIMSQQTQVSRAAEYFRKWVAKWPDVGSLAQATQEEVNELWAGLGYYRRARFLLEGAKYVAKDLDGRFPRTAKELQKIPGVGAYTSCAIASIACGERSAVVDGNVIRVLARLRMLSGDPKSGAMVKLFADLAGQALDPDRPGDFNQAMMELGATVCVPNTRPACDKCPVSPWCKARAAEKKYKSEGGQRVAVTDFPTKVEKADKREESVAVAVVMVLPPGAQLSDKGAGKFVLVKRPPGGLLAGLWEFPLQPVDAEAGDGERRGAMNELLQGLLGVDLSSSDGNELKLLERKSLGQVVHVFSHIRMTMHVEKVVLQGEVPVAEQAGGGDDGEEAAAAEVQWLSAEELGAKGLTSGVKKVFKLFTDQKTAASQSIKRFFKPAAKE